MSLFSFLRGAPQQLQYSDGYNMSVDLSRKPSMFQNGYNMQMQSAPGPEPVNGYMPYMVSQPSMETAQQIAPSLLAAPSKSGESSLSLSSGAGGAAGRAEGMVNAMSKVQDSPMLSQVQQMGGRYRRQMKGLLG